jgi:starch synthase
MGKYGTSKTSLGKDTKTGKVKNSSPVGAASQGLKILFVASECAPYAKVGGLADVVSALPKTLCKMGHDARIVMPLYASIDRAKHGISFKKSSCVHMGGREEQWIGIYHAVLDRQVPTWFVDCQRYFGRPGIYDEPWGEYNDNGFRFALLSKAALQICKDEKFIPDVMHAHDWMTSLVPVFLKTWDRILSPLSKTASVLTIHNVGYQGKYHISAFPYIGIGWEYYTPDIFEDYGKINLLKAGIWFSDAITAVSPTYAREILEPIGGQGMAPYLNNRKADLVGILNGCDYEHWNPETDDMIARTYSARDVRGKAVCKADLQKRFHLQERPDWPVFGIVSRLADQKGFTLVKEALPRALDRMVMQVAVLGTGDPATEDFFRWLTAKYPGRVGSFIGFSPVLSHVVEAGSDFFLMPSLYEPCGLNQMYSMKYGALPIVRATGGLDDTVQNYIQATGDGTGFKFLAPTGQALHDTIGWAVSTWFDRPHHIAKLRESAMVQEFSWETSAAKYVEVYEHAIKKRQGTT